MSDITHDHHDHRPSGWKRWAYSTNHKDIGTMYLVLSMVAAIIGGAASILMRAELHEPGIQFITDPQFYKCWLPHMDL